MTIKQIKLLKARIRVLKIIKPMARSIKEGLDYFPFDVDFFDDPKIELIGSEFGCKGEMIAIRLLCRIYRKCYFYPWDEDESLLLAKRVGATGALVSEVVNGLVKRGFFDKSVFDRFKVLTSRGIQQRYLEAKKRSDSVKFFRQYALITDNATLKRLNVTLIDINVTKSTQSKVKESKGEESKVITPDGPFEIAFKDFLEMRKKIRKPATEQAIRMIKSKLDTLTNGDVSLKIKILEQSILNSWQDVFPLKNQNRFSENNNRGPAAIIEMMTDIKMNQ